MKIGIFISSSGKNTGFGGHYRSLLSYMSVFEKNGNEVHLLHYTLLEASILDDINNYLVNCKSIPSLLREFNKYIRVNKPAVIFSFSDTIYSLLIRFVCYLKGIKYIHIIPGEKNKKIPIFFSNCIYLSHENMQNSTDFTSNKFLITNRVNAVKINDLLIEELSRVYPRHQLNVLRVSRINKKYLPTFISAINLHEFLQSKGLDVQTHIIGIIEDQDVCQKLKERVLGITNIEIITDEKFTKDVSKMIDYYDIVVGIGRGFWEGVSRNKVVLGFSTNNNLPVIVSEDNYQTFASLNFSPRVSIDQKFEISNNFEILTNDVKNKAYRDFLNKEFGTNYSSEALYPKLLNSIHESAKENHAFMFISFFANLAREIYHILGKKKSASNLVNEVV